MDNIILQGGANNFAVGSLSFIESGLHVESHIQDGACLYLGSPPSKCVNCVKHGIQRQYEDKNTIHISDKRFSHIHCDCQEIFFRGTALNQGTIAFMVKYIEKKAAKKIQRWYRRWKFIKLVKIPDNLLWKLKRIGLSIFSLLSEKIYFAPLSTIYRFIRSSQVILFVSFSKCTSTCLSSIGTIFTSF